MKNRLFLMYGIFNYMMVLILFVYLIGFVSDFLVPKTINSGKAGALLPSLAVNFSLITLFGLQHSLMARPAFKRWWKRIIPPPIERSTYLLFTFAALVLLVWQWQPLPQKVWTVSNIYMQTILWTLNAVGWIIVYTSTRLIDSTHFFGLSQVKRYFNNERQKSPSFQTPGFYRYTRHPMMFGFLIVFWITPQMSVGRLFFVISMTVYILIGVYFEEKDLIRHFGDRYKTYRSQVSKLIPIFNAGGDTPEYSNRT